MSEMRVVLVDLKGQVHQRRWPTDPEVIEFTGYTPARFYTRRFVRNAELTEANGCPTYCEVPEEL